MILLKIYPNLKDLLMIVSANIKWKNNLLVDPNSQDIRRKNLRKVDLIIPLLINSVKNLESMMMGNNMEIWKALPEDSKNIPLP